MHTSRLQPRSHSPVSSESSLPPGLRMPLTVHSGPPMPQTFDEVSRLGAEDDNIPGHLFGHFASAWRARLARFMTDDPVWRA